MRILKRVRGIATSVIMSVLLFGCVPKMTELPDDSKVPLSQTNICLNESILEAKDSKDIKFSKECRGDEALLDTQWWQGFGDSNLLVLLKSAREFNTQNKLTKTHIDMAREALKLSRSSLYPQASLGINPAYNKTVLHDLYGLGEVSLDFSYHLDFFGKYRHAAKAKYYELQAQIAQGYATSLMVDMLTAKAYFSYLALQERLELLNTTLQTRKSELDIIMDRESVGYISAYDTQQAKIQYESVKASLSSTRLALLKSKDTIEYLSGVNVDSIQPVMLSNLKSKDSSYTLDSSSEFAMTESSRTTESRHVERSETSINFKDSPHSLDSPHAFAMMDLGHVEQSETSLKSQKKTESRATQNLDSKKDSSLNTHNDRVKQNDAGNAKGTRNAKDTKEVNTKKNTKVEKTPFESIAIPALPSYISVKLLNERPDVMYANFMLAASNEKLASARADFLPDFSIGINLGAVGIENFTQFLAIGGIGASILTPIFKGGELKARFGIANALMQEAAYMYRDVVIKAYMEAKETYASIYLISDELKILAKQESAAKEALYHAKERYNMGYSSYLEVIDAQRSLLEIQINMINLKNMYLESLIDFYIAMGGGVKWNAKS